MLASFRMRMLVGMLILLACPVRAQESTGQNATRIRQSIEQLEKRDIRSKSAEVRMIYKRTLLRKYTEYISALQQDIAEIKQIQADADAPGTPPDKETVNLLKQLSEELSVTSEKALTLREDVKQLASADNYILKPSEVAAISEASNATEVRPRTLGNANPLPTPGVVKPDFLRADAPPPNRVSPSALRDTDTGNAEAVSAVSTTALQDTTKPSVVQGTVTVINEHFFVNPEGFSPSQIRHAAAHSGLSTTRNNRSTRQSAQDGDQTRVEICPEPKLQERLIALNLNKSFPAICTTLRRTTNNKITDEDARRAGVLLLRDEYGQKLNTPLSGATVRAVQIQPNGDRTTIKTTKTGRDGNYVLSLSPGEYIIVAEMGGFTAEEPLTVAAPVPPATTPVAVSPVDLQLLVRPLGEFSRAIVGFEQAGASSAKSSQKYFFDLTVSAPVPLPGVHAVDPFFGQRVRAWGTVRVTSVPQQITSPVGTFATQFAQNVSNVPVNEVAQALEFLAGGEIRLTKRWINFGSFDGKTTNKFNLSLIFGGGAITPLNPRDTLEVFKIFPGAPGLPEIPAGKEFIAFVSPDRDRFFRQFYAGFRAHGYYFDYKNPDIPLKRYPATLDVTFGMNESVTGGRLRGGVLRLEGFYPLPYNDLEFINLFGTAIIKPTRTRIQDPLILEPAPAGTTVPAANVFLVTVPQINRDYYRVGVGIDVISLIKKLPQVSGNK